MPMAPQQPPQGGPPPSGPQGPQQGGGDPSESGAPKKSPTQLISDIHQDLMDLSSFMKQAGLPPDDLKAVSALQAGFETLVDELSKPQGDQGQSQPPQSPGGPQDPNQGASGMPS